MNEIERPDWWREELQSCVLERAAKFAEVQLGRERMQAAFEALGEVGEGLGLPLLLAHTEIDGRTALSGLAGSEAAEELEPAERAWLEAERAACFTAWVIKGVLKGRGLLLVDGIGTAGSRFVHEPGLARAGLSGAWLLGRVLEWEGQSYLAGFHPRPLCEHVGVRVASAMAGIPSRRRTARLAASWRDLLGEGCGRCETAPADLEADPMPGSTSLD